MVAVNIYRFILPYNDSEIRESKNFDYLINILNKDYLGYLYSKKGETRNAMSGEENKDDEEQNKSHSGCSDTSSSNIPENLDELENYYLNEKNIFMLRILSPQKF